MNKFQIRSLLLALFSIAFACQEADAQPNWKRMLQVPQAAVSTNEAKTLASVDYPQQCTGFRWSEAHIVWDTVSQTQFTYNQSGGLLVKTTSNWTQSGFDPDFREFHHYNTNGYDSMTVAETWNGTAWESSYRFLRTFDPFGNVMQSIGQIWNGTDWDTSSGYRATFTYRNTDQVASVVQESYSVGVGWFPDYKMEYSFDLQDRWDTIVGYTTNQGLWVPDIRLLDMGWHDFSKVLPDSGRYQQFDTTWDDYQRFHVTYSQYDSQVWIYQKFGTTWDDSDKLVLQYDAKGNETRNETYRWIGAWLQTDGILTHYTYGTQDEKLEVWQELFDGYIYRYDNRQVYANFFTGESPATMPALNVVVFPNPVRNSDAVQVMVNSARPATVEVTLRDAFGHVVSHQKSSIAFHSRQVAIRIPETVANGILFYEINAGAQRATGRLLLQR